jgi:hypothetical protein
MKLVGHKTQAIYSRYAIADERMLKEGGTLIVWRQTSRSASRLPPTPAACSGSGDVVVSPRAGAPTGCSTAPIGTYGGETAVGKDGGTFHASG